MYMNFEILPLPGVFYGMQSNAPPVCSWYSWWFHLLHRPEQCGEPSDCRKGQSLWGTSLTSCVSPLYTSLLSFVICSQLYFTVITLDADLYHKTCWSKFFKECINNRFPKEVFIKIKSMFNCQSRLVTLVE